MKKQPMSFVLQAPKARNHRALFDRELPFQPKVEKSAKAFRRKPKHPKGEF
jgi:hypothetical protein